MSGLTAEQRGDMAEALLPEAAGLVVDVHEGSVQDIADRMRGLSRHELEAMAVVLAGLVDPDRSLGDALRWVDFDERGEPLRRGLSGAWGPVRGAASERACPGAGVDEVSVLRALTPGGAAVQLNQAERRRAIRVGIRRGMTHAQVAERLGMSVEAVQRSWERSKARERGEARSSSAA